MNLFDDDKFFNEFGAVPIGAGGRWGDDTQPIGGTMIESERPLIEVAREMMKRRMAFDVQESPSCTNAYIAGYDDAISQRQTIRSEWDANKAMDLEAAHDRITELEAQLATRPAVIGVEVTDEMCDTLRKELAERVWKLSPADMHACLTAALRTARTVPLGSVEPVRWLTSDDDSGAFLTLDVARQYCDGNPIPLYRGIAEVSRGE